MVIFILYFLDSQICPSNHMGVLSLNLYILIIFKIIKNCKIQCVFTIKFYITERRWIMLKIRYDYVHKETKYDQDNALERMRFIEVYLGIKKIQVFFIHFIFYSIKTTFLSSSFNPTIYSRTNTNQSLNY